MPHVVRRARLSFCGRSVALTLALAALTALQAHAQTVVTFDFQGAPDGGNLNPTYTVLDGDFVLSHTPVTGTAERVRISTSPANYAMRLIKSPSNHYGPFTARIVFSRPVTSISMLIKNGATKNASITPILFQTPPVLFTSTTTTPPTCPGSTAGQPIAVPPTKGKFITCSFPALADNLYVGLEITTTSHATLYWDNLVVTYGYAPDATSLRNVPIPTGENVPMIDLDALDQAASEVIANGLLDVDLCIFLDKRVQGSYVQNRSLRLSEAIGTVNGTGSCTGSFWQDFLAQGNDFEIPSIYRSFRGTFTPPNGVPTIGNWLVLVHENTTAIVKGAVAVQARPESLIDFDPGLLDVDGELRCNTTLDWRPLSLSGDATRGLRMLNESAQCNRPSSLTRRSTHVAPVRLAGLPFIDELANLLKQLDAAKGTLDLTSQCTTNPASIQNLNTMRSLLAAAKVSILIGQWDNAVARLEQIAIFADTDASNFEGCDPAENLGGDNVAHAIRVAFTVWDRFKHFRVATWQPYLVPVELELPLLTPDSD